MQGLVSVNHVLPLSEERAARIAARTLPAGGEVKTEPTTAAVKRPCPTNPKRKGVLMLYSVFVRS